MTVRPATAAQKIKKKKTTKTKRGTQTDLQDAAVHVCHGTRMVTEHCVGGGLASEHPRTVGRLCCQVTDGVECHRWTLGPRLSNSQETE